MQNRVPFVDGKPKGSHSCWMLSNEHQANTTRCPASFCPNHKLPFGMRLRNTFDCSRIATVGTRSLLKHPCCQARCKTVSLFALILSLSPSLRRNGTWPPSTPERLSRSVRQRATPALNALLKRSKCLATPSWNLTGGF